MSDTKPVTDEMVVLLIALCEVCKLEAGDTDNLAAKAGWLRFADAVDAVLAERGKDKDEIRLLGKALKGANDDFLELEADVERLRGAIDQLFAGGNHGYHCNVHTSGNCTCGWHEACAQGRAALAAVGPEPAEGTEPEAKG